MALADDAVPLLFPIRPVEDRERVSFGVEHPTVERDEVLVREEEVQVLQPADTRRQQESNYTTKA